MARRATKTADAAVQPASVPLNAAELIREAIALEDYKKGESARFKEFMKPTEARLDEIDNALLIILNQQRADNIKTDEGTAYKSRLLNISIDPESDPYTDNEGATYKGQEALLYFALDNPDTYGLDGLLIKPAMEQVKQYVEDHEGKAPPGVKVSYYTRVNIRRS